MDLIFQKTINSFDKLLLSATQYGRSIELASGFGFWIVALTLLFSSNYGFTYELLGIQAFYWSWVFMLLGACQIAYGKLITRLFTDMLAAVVWLTLAFYTYIATGDWSIATATCSTLGIFNFYIYGYIFMECK